MAGNEILAVGHEAQEAYDESQKQTTETTDTPAAETPAVDTPATDSPAVDTETPQGEGDEGKSQEDEQEVHTHYFGDIAVDVEIPAEISAAFAEHKIDADKLLTELFAKDGKFELSEETRKPLDKAFGKTLVDGYLNMYRTQNQQFIDKHKQDAEAAKQTLEANSKDFDTLIGGEEGWTELADWAGDNLSESELANFNAVMQLPVEHYAAQRAVIEALQIKRQASVKEIQGDSDVRLVTDDGAGSRGVDKGALPASLTREEFQSLFSSERYRKDPQWAQQVDAVRRKTQAAEKGSRR